MTLAKNSLVLAASFLLALETAAYAQVNDTTNRSNMTVPSETRISVRNNDAIDSQNASPGQTFSATVVQDVEGAAGEVLIPKDSPAELLLVLHDSH